MACSLVTAVEHPGKLGCGSLDDHCGCAHGVPAVPRAAPQAHPSLHSSASPLAQRGYSTAPATLSCPHQPQLSTRWGKHLKVTM